MAGEFHSIRKFVRRSRILAVSNKVEVTTLKSANVRNALIDIGKSYIVFDSIIHQTAVARVKVTLDPLKKDNKSELVPGSPRSVELAWAILPALVLSVLLVVTWRKVAEREEHRHMDHSAAGPTALRQFASPIKRDL